MSRTDSTKPLWVRSLEHDPMPVHDHRFGPCDLPPRRPTTREPADTRCLWHDPYRMLFVAACCAGCNDRSCRKEWQAMVRVANRADRHAARRAAHDATRRYARGLGDED